MNMARLGLYAVRGVMGCSHLLVDDAGAVLIDTGLIGEPLEIRLWLWRLGLGPDAVKAILLTHGHLDHTGNVAWAKTFTGAPLYAHPLDQAHINGTHPYAGVTQWCDWLERAGRSVLRVGAPASIDVAIGDGDELPFWGGLRVIHLPGHTLGHCGFYSPRHNLLFSGDLFGSTPIGAHIPPPIFNDAPELYPDSLDTVRRLDPRLIVPNHYDFLDGRLHRHRFDRLMERRARLPTPGAISGSYDAMS
jgi:glyoxylase-like metal-dependent hydrolase (beta-lactamase superfamily II)